MVTVEIEPDSDAYAVRGSSASIRVRDDDGGPGGGSGSGGGGGGGGGSRDRPPKITEAIPAQGLDIGAEEHLQLAGYFRDPEGRPLRYDSTSQDPSVVGATLDGATLTLIGVFHGDTSVSVTASDAPGREAVQTFAVRVGHVVSFPETAVTVAEGDSAALSLVLSRPSPLDLTAPYTVRGAGAAPADAADHDARDAELLLRAGTTGATLVIVIPDDADIEPAHETFAIDLGASLTVRTAWVRARRC